MEWNWMVEGFVWIIQSPRERTHLRQASTWAGQLTVVVVVEVEALVEAAVVDVEILTMIEDTIEDMTDTKIMITGTEEDHLLLIIVDTDHGQDLVPTVQDAIDNGVAAIMDFVSYFSFFNYGFPQAFKNS